MRKEKHAPPFFRATSGVARFGKQFECAHTRNFCRAEGPVKMLVGELPNPLNFWTKCPEVQAQAPVVCVPELSLLGLIFPPVRMAEQMVNVRLDRNSLPHIRLGLAVLGIEGLFLFGELPALLFQCVHFRELCAA